MPPGPGEPLPSWNDGPGKRTVLDFVSRLSKRGGPDFVLENDRIAVFHNDGTLWCDMPAHFDDKAGKPVCGA
jgi:hypothetical protein